MSQIARLMRLAASAGGLPDSQLSSLLTETSLGGSSFASRLHITETNDPTKFLIFYWRADYYRGRVVTLSGSSLSIGSEQQLVNNRFYSSHISPGMRWDSANGAAIGVVMDDSNFQIKAMRVTYSGTSMSFTVSAGIEDSGNPYRTPAYGPACVYNSTDNVYFAIYGDNSSVYIKPFTVSGSSFSLGTRRGIGVSHVSFPMNAIWIPSSSALYVQSMGYNSGSGQYWNTISSVTYSGGSNGSFTSVISNNNYNTQGSQAGFGGMLYNEAEGTLYLFSRDSSSGKMTIHPSTPGSNGALSIGSRVFINFDNFSTPPSGNSSFSGGVYDPISEAILVHEVTGQYSSRLVQLRSNGNVMSEQTQVGSFFNTFNFDPPATGAVVSDTNNRTLLAVGNGKDPFNFPEGFITIYSLTP